MCVCFLQINSQIDDKEFDIPQVDTPPTLESILNEVKLDNNAVWFTTYRYIYENDVNI